MCRVEFRPLGFTPLLTSAKQVNRRYGPKGINSAERILGAYFGNYLLSFFFFYRFKMNLNALVYDMSRRFTDLFYPPSVVESSENTGVYPDEIAVYSNTTADKLPRNFETAKMLVMHNMKGKSRTFHTLAQVECLAYVFDAQPNTKNLQHAFSDMIGACLFPNAPCLETIYFQGAKLGLSISDGCSNQLSSGVCETIEFAPMPNGSAKDLDWLENIGGPWNALKELTFNSCERLTRVNVEASELKRVTIKNCLQDSESQAHFSIEADSVRCLTLVNTRVDVYFSPSFEKIVDLRIEKPIEMYSFESDRTHLKRIVIRDAADLTLVDAGEAMIVEIYNCNNLETLLLSPTVMRVVIANCEKIQTVVGCGGTKLFTAMNCPNLTSVDLSNDDEIFKIVLHDNERLVNVSVPWDVMAEVSLTKCPKIDVQRFLTVTALPRLKTLKLWGMPQIVSFDLTLPQVFEVDIKYCDNFMHLYADKIEERCSFDLMGNPRFNKLWVGNPEKVTVKLTDCKSCVDISQAVGQAHMVLLRGMQRGVVFPETMGKVEMLLIENSGKGIRLPRCIAEVERLILRNLEELIVPDRIDAPHFVEIRNVHCLANMFETSGASIDIVDMENITGCKRIPDSWGSSYDFTVSNSPDLRHVPKLLHVENSITLRGLPNLEMAGMTISAGSISLEKLQIDGPPEHMSADTVSFFDCPKLVKPFHKLSCDVLSIRNCANLKELPVEILEPLREKVVAVSLAGVTHFSGKCLREKSDATPHVRVDFSDAVFFDQSAYAEQLGKITDVSHRVTITEFVTALATCKEASCTENVAVMRERISCMLDTYLKVDEDVRQSMVTCMENSFGACNDKPVLALNAMHSTILVADASKDFAKLEKVGLSIMRLEVVHQHARRAIRKMECIEMARGLGLNPDFVSYEDLVERRKVDPTAGTVDDVSVVLFFEITLKHRLGLPVVSSGMFFPEKIPESWLKDAAAEAQAITYEDFAAWRKHWAPWQKLQRTEFAAAFRPEQLEELQMEFEEEPEDIYGSKIEADKCVQVDGVATLFSIDDILAHWVNTGKTFYNSVLPLSEFRERVKRCVPIKSLKRPMEVCSARETHASKRPRTDSEIEAAENEEAASNQVVDSSIETEDDKNMDEDLRDEPAVDAFLDIDPLDVVERWERPASPSDVDSNDPLEQKDAWETMSYPGEAESVGAVVSGVVEEDIGLVPLEDFGFTPAQTGALDDLTRASQLLGSRSSSAEPALCPNEVTLDGSQTGAGVTLENTGQLPESCPQDPAQALRSTEDPSHDFVRKAMTTLQHPAFSVTDKTPGSLMSSSSSSWEAASRFTQVKRIVRKDGGVIALSQPAATSKKRTYRAIYMVDSDGNAKKLYKVVKKKAKTQAQPQVPQRVPQNDPGSQAI